MGIKTAKFGGSSVADGIQLAKIKDIIEADKDRRYIVVSAPGKRFDGDSKITDLLFMCKAQADANIPYEQLLQVVTDRYSAIKYNLDIDVDLDKCYDEILDKLAKGCSEAYTSERSRTSTTDPSCVSARPYRGNSVDTRRG